MKEYFITHWSGKQSCDKDAIAKSCHVMLDETYISGLISALITFGPGDEWHTLISITDFQSESELNYESARLMREKYFEPYVSFKDEVTDMPENSITIYNIQVGETLVLKADGNFGMGFRIGMEFCKEYDGITAEKCKCEYDKDSNVKYGVIDKTGINTSLSDRVDLPTFLTSY